MATGLNVDQFKSKVDAMLGALPDHLIKVNAGLARGALSLVRNRIREDGVDHTGKPFTPYSTNPLPTFFFTHKGLGSDKSDKALQSFIKKERKAQGENFKGISYKQFRDLNGLRTDKKVLSFTNETLNDIDVLESKQEGKIITTVVASKNSIKKAKYKADGSNAGTIGTEDVLEHLADKYGDLLSLSAKEEEDITAAFDAELQTFIDGFLK